MFPPPTRKTLWVDSTPAWNASQALTLSGALSMKQRRPNSRLPPPLRPPADLDTSEVTMQVVRRDRRAMRACAVGLFLGALFWHTAQAQALASPDQLAEAEAVVAKCGAGTDVGRDLSFEVTAELTRLVGVGGSVGFDASY